MNRKIFLLTLCFLIALIPMLFGADKTDAIEKSVVPTITSPRKLLVDHKPTHFDPDRSGALLFDQHATHYTTLDACQNDSNMGFYPRIADNFTVPYDANVDSVVFWGGYWNGTPSPPLDFNIEIYPDSVGFNQPMQAPIYTARVGFNETPISPPSYYVYEAVIPPFAATAGVTYWIVFQPFLYFPPQWGNNCDYPPEWGDGQPEFFKSAFFGYPLWTPAMTVFGRPDETSFQIYGPAAAFFWDFEDGWQGWTHTNGLPFPGGWEPYDATYRSGWGYLCPNSDDSSMCIDSDLYFGATMDTALSPFLVPSPTMDWLNYGFFYNDLATHFDYLEVGIKYFDGSTWTVAPLKTYDSDYLGNWDSVDVSAYSTYDLIQLYFYYHAPGWYYYVAFDNVSIGVILAEHDVGCDQIASPPAGTNFPGDYDVIGNIKNFGDFIETFDATATVYDTLAGWTIIFKTTLTITNFSPGAESLVNFGMVTLEDNKVYYTEIYTELVGDEHPENDTTTATCVTSSQFWEILDPPLFPLPCAGHSEASTHDGYYYVFGISSTDTVLVYDIANNQWLDGTTNPYGAGKYGTANAVNGKFYRVGGTAAFPTPLQRIDILDPPNTWSAGATPPTGFLDQITGVYNDSLLYVFGSGQWSMTPTTGVYFYDTYLDSWTTCTSFPSPGRGAMAGGIIDSFAILAFGYTTGNNYSNDYVVGIIDETDPSNITWGTWTSTGLTGCRRVPSGADEFNKVLWVIGGQVSAGQLDRTLSYDPYTDVWTDWAMPKPQPICNVTPLPITTTAAGDIGVFVGGGYTSGYVGNHEVFHTAYYVGIEEKAVEKTETALVFGFAPDMPTLTKAYTAIKYTTTESRNVSLKIYNASGRLVRTLVDRPRERSGTKTVYWNGKDNGGKTVASGVYFYRLVAEEKVATKKIVVIR